ncbi:GNAT family N-acetyltransferase [Bradyrhizobium prioriisuperbiae]|uniref:GNAT family N-acetyltransferase n=1 Tax=Bradyrhizobium prioriisuperbiae TaxID=2854389 RepID=UPI0028F13D57|nr:GNAT family N-acetyltransferase [Bradyrhizobium prioritasuperba]
MIKTDRLRLRPWHETDRDSFATMNADPEVMHDLGGPIGRVASDAKLDRYVAAFNRHGFCRWVIENHAGDFLGYAGVMPAGPDHPLGRHFEIGWRLVRSAWGHGYVTEAAQGALDDAFKRAGLQEIVSYTAADNLRSQAVMSRLGLQRDGSRDFTAHYQSTGAWHGLIWVARSPENNSSASDGTE